MRAGKRDRLITIQQNNEGQDGAGGLTEDWTDYATDVPANVTPSLGRNQYTADQLTAENQTTFNIRWMTGVTEKMRIVYPQTVAEGQKFYTIIGAPVEIGRRKEIVIRGEVIETN